MASLKEPTAACEQGHHWNCSARVVRGLVPFGRLGRYEEVGA